MPLFECSKCGAIDNTAISGYWEQQMNYFEAQRDLKDFKPECSECFTGTWHGEFPKKLAKEEGYIADSRIPGFIMPKGGWG